MGLEAMAYCSRISQFLSRTKLKGKERKPFGTGVG